MSELTRGFIDPNTAKHGIDTQHIVLKEINDIEKLILDAVKNSRMDLKVTSTLMTSTSFPSPMIVGSVNISTDNISITNHGLVTGDEILISSTLTLPAPLMPLVYYYVIKVDDNTFKLATSTDDSFSGIYINITSIGSGVISITKQLESERYYRVWENYYNQNESDRRVYSFRMSLVEEHFKNIGYTIVRRNNPNTNKTFLWQIQW